MNPAPNPSGPHGAGPNPHRQPHGAKPTLNSSGAEPAHHPSSPKPTRPFCIVCTTIRSVDVFLQRYFANLQAFGHLHETTLVLVMDRKTPSSVVSQCQSYLARGLDARALTLEAQAEFLRPYGRLAPLIPLDSDNRRNVGYLYAYAGGSQTIISVDDDNFPLESDDFIAGHAACGTRQELPVLSSESRWLNVLADAQTDNGTLLYPRGFPRSRRSASLPRAQNQSVSICANLGLWLQDPDVDAASRIENPACIIGYNPPASRALALRTFSPINSQNTSVSRRALAAYYFIPQGQVVDGEKIDRYGDIWQGFFLKACADAMGEHVLFGPPLCRHERNAHDLQKDLQQERPAVRCTEELAAFLEQVKLEGRTYSQCYADLADKLAAHFAASPYAALFSSISKSMKVWASYFEEE
ncbi:Reversibly glycosylated polypeptide [uncultured archaeon]|nr:Reversibly glycosylated polypeptide [uncultured archaeon]